MVKITTGITPDTRKMANITTGITMNTRKMAFFTADKSLTAGVIASRGFSVILSDEKIYQGIWLRI